MKKPKLHPLIAWVAPAPTPATPLDPPPDGPGTRLPSVSAHVDYDHRPLSVGPLDHFDRPDDSERFLIR